jgi:hypothetical protein
MKDSGEVWKTLVFNDGYEVSNKGNLRSLDRMITNSIGVSRCYKGLPIKYKPDKNGYFIYKFLVDGKYKHYKIHRLIAELFIENPDNLPQINHKDGDKTNNNIGNLEWITNKYNLKHARLSGLNKGRKGKKIIQLDLSGNLVKIWDSHKEASEKLGIDLTRLWKCLNKKVETAGNFKWRKYEHN